MNEIVLHVIGWASASALVFTIAAQVHRQWRAGRSDGVSAWLFIGQLAASLGFIVYSSARADWVFVVANACGSVFAVIGLLLLMSHRRAARARAVRALTRRTERPAPGDLAFQRQSGPPCPPIEHMH